MKAIFGYDAQGDGGGGWFSTYYNQVRFVFRCQEYGETRYRCAVFYDVKLYSDGTIRNIDTLDPSITDSFESVEKLEETLTSNWQNINTIAEK